MNPTPTPNNLNNTDQQQSDISNHQQNINIPRSQQQLQQENNNFNLSQQQQQSQQIQNMIQLDSKNQQLNNPQESQTQQKTINYRILPQGLQTRKQIIHEQQQQLKRANNIKQRESSNYSNEIQKNNILPSIESKYLQLILSKPPSQRNIKELIFVKECLSQLDVFQTWNNNYNNSQIQLQTEESIEQQQEQERKQLSLYKYLIYKSYTKHAAVFLQDDLPRECYAILKGEVLVLQDDHSKKQEKTEAYINSLINEFELTKEEYELINLSFPNQIIIGRIKQGKMFGELGLNYEKTRSATVISRFDELIVGSLDYKSYQLTLQQQQCRSKERLVEFLRGVSLFKGIEDNQLNILVLSCHSIKRKINTIIYKENDPIDYIYFVMNGEIEIQQRIEKQKNNNNNNSFQQKQQIKLQQYENEKEVEEEIYDNDEMIVSDMKESIALNRHYKPISKSEDKRNNNTIIKNNQLTSNNNQNNNNVKQLQLLAEQRQFNYLNAQKQQQIYTCFIVGKNQIFGEQQIISTINDKRNNSAKVISSFCELLRIKSQTFFDIIENSFHKAHPNINIIQILNNKNIKMEKHRVKNIISKQQCYDLLEKEQKKNKSNDLYSKYGEDYNTATTSINAILDNIQNNIINESDGNKKQQIQQKFNYNYNNTPKSASLNSSRQRKSFCSTNNNNASNGMFKNQELDISLTTAISSKNNNICHPNLLLSHHNSARNNYNNNNNNKSVGSFTNNYNINTPQTNRGNNTQTHRQMNNSPYNQNIINDFNGQFTQACQLQQFQSVNQLDSINQNRLNLQQNNLLEQDNSLISCDSPYSKMNSFSQASTNISKFLYQNTPKSSNQSTPTSAKINKKVSCKSQYYTPKIQLFSQRLRSQDPYKNNNQGQGQGQQEDSNTISQQNNIIPLLFHDKSQNEQEQQQQENDDQLISIKNQISYSVKNLDGIITTTNKQSQLFENKHKRSQSNPHCQKFDLSTKQNNLELNNFNIPQYQSSQQQNQNNHNINKNNNIQKRQGVKPNTIFDILYPDLVQQVNRQIGVLKTIQSVKNSEIRQNFQHKPQVDTIKINFNDNNKINQIESQIVNTPKQKNNNNNNNNIKQSNNISIGSGVDLSCMTPIKIKEYQRLNINSQNQLKVEQLELQNQQQNKNIIDEDQDQKIQQNQEINFNDKMCITYKHLRLHKIFPESPHSNKTKQYFYSAEKDFKAKIDFDKYQIKQKTTQIPYMQQIESKLLTHKYDITKESFNFISKKNQ